MDKKKEKRLLDGFEPAEQKLPKKKKKNSEQDKAARKLAKMEKRLEKALDFEWETISKPEETLLRETTGVEEPIVLRQDKEYFAELKAEDEKDVSPKATDREEPKPEPEKEMPKVAPSAAESEKTKPKAESSETAAKPKTKRAAPKKNRSKMGLFAWLGGFKKKEKAKEKPARAETQLSETAETSLTTGKRRNAKEELHVDGKKLHSFWEKKQWTWKMVLTRALIVLAIIGLGVFEVFKLCDNSYFVDTFYEVEDDKIVSHIRIVLLTDLHLNVFGNDNDVLVEEIARLQPDIIAMAGDMVDMNRTDYSTVLSLCERLVDVAPIYFSYGNHEKEVIRVLQTSTINEDLEAIGVHVLHNRYETIEVNGNRIDIGGLSANPGTMDAEYTQSFWQKYMTTENYRLLLVHYPQFFYPDGELQNCGIDMALCGHLHGGQVVIPYFGGLYHPTGGFHPDLADGCTLVGDTRVVVSRGLGNGKSIPRVNNPPELVIVDLY